MKKKELLDTLLMNNGGYLKTSDVVEAGISRPYLGEYVHKQGLERVAHGLYMSPDAWQDGMYVLQVRYPNAIFSHETALYLHHIAEREPMHYSLTCQAGVNAQNLSNQGVKVYKIKSDLYEMGLVLLDSPIGHPLRAYNMERTLCDLIRSKNQVDQQEMLSAIKAYVRLKDKNIPLLMQYAQVFSVEQRIKPYLEVLLS